MDKQKEKTIIKFKDRNLTLHYYKEPLTKVKNGYGFIGCLLSTIEGDAVQCHICGELFIDLAKHVSQKHNITSVEYKDKFQLARKTALISENERMARKQRFLNYLKSLTEEEKREFKIRARERYKNNHSRSRQISLETKNKRGTCPDQLLQKIKDVAKKIGHTPSKTEFINECDSQRYVHLIYKTFGSWTKALKLIGMEPKKPINTGNSDGYNQYNKKYSDEELLEYLVIFAQENNRKPTATDFRRGLLPPYYHYTRRWGGIENARLEAGVYNFIE